MKLPFLSLALLLAAQTPTRAQTPAPALGLNFEQLEPKTRLPMGWVLPGSTTAGADGNVSTIILPGNISTWISGLGIYYPDGRETQRVGIVPDVVATPTIAGIRAGRDEVLEKAVQPIEAK